MLSIAPSVLPGYINVPEFFLGGSESGCTRFQDVSGQHFPRIHENPKSIQADLAGHPGRRNYPGQDRIAWSGYYPPVSWPLKNGSQYITPMRFLQLELDKPCLHFRVSHVKEKLECEIMNPRCKKNKKLGYS